MESPVLVESVDTVFKVLRIPPKNTLNVRDYVWKYLQGEHDHYVEQLPYKTSYAMHNGHLWCQTGRGYALVWPFYKHVPFFDQVYKVVNNSILKGSHFVFYGQEKVVSFHNLEDMKGWYYTRKEAQDALLSRHQS